MELKDILDLDFCLFSPAISYSGEWLLNYTYSNNLQDDILYLNSNWEGNVNKVENFLLKHYHEPMMNIFNSKTFQYIPHPAIVFGENNDGRTLKFSFDLFFVKLIMALSLTDYKNFDASEFSKMSLEKKIDYFRNAFRDERKLVTDVINNGNKSVYYNTLYSEYQTKFDGKITFDIFLERRVSVLMKYIFACRWIKDIFDKNLDANELVECFDFDRFALIACKSCLDDLVMLHESSNNVSTSVYYLYYYFSAVKYMRDINPNYNCKIRYKEDGVIKTVDIDTLKEKYEEIMQKHPEFKFTIIEDMDNYIISHGLSEDEISQLNRKEFSELMMSLIKTDNYEETTREEIEGKINEIASLVNSVESTIEKNRLIQQKEKMEFLLENSPVSIIKGVGTFSNYYGYVYSNGYVVFDVLDRNLSKSYGNALYIMPFHKIKEYSDKKKKDLRKNLFDDVSIINHRGDWKQRLLDKLNEVRSVDANFDFDGASIDISSITSLEELEKIRAQLSLLDSKTNQDFVNKRRRIVALKEIDVELRTEEYDENISFHESSQFNDEIDWLLEIDEVDFEHLYIFWKANKDKHVVKRNPVVAAITKKRARDQDGNYCCELCGSKSFDSRSFDSHHMIPISQGGIDNIYNTVCLCPSCHRLIHSNRVTLSQQFDLLHNIKIHLVKDNPEYLPEFDILFSPNCFDQEYYEQHKDEIDRNFAIDWNGFRR